MNVRPAPRPSADPSQCGAYPSGECMTCGFYRRPRMHCFLHEVCDQCSGPGEKCQVAMILSEPASVPA